MISPIFDLPKRIGVHNFEAMTAIDLGCGRYESDVARQVLEIPFKKLVSVEGYKPDFLTMKTKRFSATTHIPLLMNVQDVPESEVYDWAFAFDIIEHLTKEEGEKFLNKLDRIARRVILFLPLEPEGFHRRNPEPSNPLQEHISHWEEKDFERRGYKVEQIENGQSEYQKETDSYLYWPVLWAMKTNEI